MGKFVFDYERGDFLHAVSEDMAMDAEGDLLMRMGDTMAMDMSSGELHMVSGWSDEEDE